MKKYTKPHIETITIDNVIVLQNESEIDQGDLFNTSSSTNETNSSDETTSTKENNFDENPFER